LRKERRKKKGVSFKTNFTTTRKEKLTFENKNPENITF